MAALFTKRTTAQWPHRGVLISIFYRKMQKEWAVNSLMHNWKGRYHYPLA